MDEDTEIEIEVVDLGEAKELTKGSVVPPLIEDNPGGRYKHG